MLRPFTLLLASLFLLAFPPAASAQVPQLINYQGRVIVDGVNFDGAGQFKFALVNTTGTTTYWSNDGSSTAGSQPTAAVTLTVTKGLYSVLLGDATVANMTIVPATVFTHGDVHLRVWFNDGTHGFEQLTPDKRIAAVGYALMAADVPDGIITTSKIADGAITASKIAPGLGMVGKFDRQRSLLTIPKSAGSTYTDVVSIVTRDLGEAGCYVISFNASFADAGASFLLNVNGVDINETATQGSSIDWYAGLYQQANTAQINYIANDVPAGATIKVKARSNSGSYFADIQDAHLTIDGVPQSYVK